MIELSPGGADWIEVRRNDSGPPPARRGVLEAYLDLVPGAWWWKILPVDDAGAEHRSIFSSRVLASEEAAERSGRAAGAGWGLHVHGPGCVRAHGRLAR